MIKELPTFLRPCRVQLFHLGTIAALEPERQAGCIALAVAVSYTHLTAVGPSAPPITPTTKQELLPTGRNE